MNFIEMVIIVASVFGCGLAMMRSTETPWRAPGAAFGCGILSLGIQGTTGYFISGLAQMAEASKATRDVAFNELLNHAYSPMYAAVVGLFFFLLTVRSVPIGDDRNSVTDNMLAALMLAGSFGGLASMAAYHLEFLGGDTPNHPTQWMNVTSAISLATLAVCVLGGAVATWQTIQQPEPVPVSPRA